MRVILRIDGGPYAGGKIRLRKDSTSLGSGSQADISLRGDAALVPSHLVFELGGNGCRVRSLAGAGGVTVNQQPVNDAALRSSDQLGAGSSRFTILLDDASEEESSAPGFPGHSESRVGEEVRAAELCAELNLGEPARLLLQEAHTPWRYADRLAKEYLYPDAVRVIAHALPKRAAVWWACRCVNGNSQRGVVDAAALDAAWRWVIDPSEEHREVAKWEAERAKDQAKPGVWAARGAFWSGESLSTPDLPLAPPPDSLTSAGVINALTFAAYREDHPQKAEARMIEFYEVGRKMADETEFEWPKERPRPAK